MTPARRSESPGTPCFGLPAALRPQGFRGPLGVIDDRLLPLRTGRPCRRKALRTRRAALVRRQIGGARSGRLGSHDGRKASLGRVFSPLYRRCSTSTDTGLEREFASAARRLTSEVAPPSPTQLEADLAAILERGHHGVQVGAVSTPLTCRRKISLSVVLGAPGLRQKIGRTAQKDGSELHDTFALVTPNKNDRTGGRGQKNIAGVLVRTPPITCCHPNSLIRNGSVHPLVK